MLNSKAIVCGFCLFFVIGLAAQDCHLALRGYVREEGSEIPLAYATVMVREVARGATTDENGHFAISDLCENTAYTVEVKHLECEHFTQIVSLTENTELCFHLQHHVLAEVVVHEKALAARITNAQNTVDQADLEAARGLNLGETLKKLPQLRNPSFKDCTPIVSLS
jgi:iron complex outermembrane recepter protein